MKVLAALGLLLLCPLLDAETPEEQTPGAQTPAPASTPTSTPAPAPAKSQAGKSTFEENESVWSFSVFYWKPQDSSTHLAGGKKSTDPNAQTHELLGKAKEAPGFMLTIPTGRSNRIEISGWQTKTTGSFTSTRSYTFFAETFAKDTFIVTENRVRNLKMTWNYLSYPYPALDSKFRIKTLWEVQYVQLNPALTAPFTATPASGSTAAVDAKQGKSKRTIILPTFGLGFELIPSEKHFRMEARGTGMAFPGKSQIWDVEGTATLRLWNLEVFGGAKLFHYRSTQNNEQYLRGNIWGPLAGVRWVFR